MPYTPTSTYRIQFSKTFTLEHLKAIIPYLKRLGVGAVYASPLFEAVADSTHGYDQVNPQQINPEIGTLKQLRQLSLQLGKSGIGWIQDIVPNHMAFHPANPWVWDILENGPHAAHRQFFDTVFADDAYFSGPLMLPFLRVPLAEAIQRGEITLGYDDSREAFVLSFAGQQWPVNAAGYARILQQCASTDAGGGQVPDAIQALPDKKSAAAYTRYSRDLRRQVAGLGTERLRQVAARVNAGKTGISQLVACQYYEPCEWQATEGRINYRRFFTINGLIGTNVQHRTVFRAVHRLIGKLVDEGVFKGLRIDHVDGLADPTGYLHQLRQRVGDECYLIAEKILQRGESLPRQWPIQGTTGYEFLAVVNQVLTCGRNASRFTRFYMKLTGDGTPLPDLLLRAKQEQLHGSMEGELTNLYRFFCEHVAAGRLSPDIGGDTLKPAIAAFLVHCPVYRWYGHAFPLTETEAASIQATLQQASVAAPHLRNGLRMIEASLFPQQPAETQERAVSAFYRRCMQLTGSLMAKSLEDTLMYIYSRYIGSNEVGDAPKNFGTGKTAFHQFMQARSASYPHALNATATHDTKRGEDVRARLQVISAIPRVWFPAVHKWMKGNAPFKIGGMPDVNDEYFIYQTLWGTWPMPGQSVAAYRKRLKVYLVKAMREAKRHTDWNNPDPNYESATLQFVDQILKTKSPFLNNFRKLHTAWLDHGILNSLTQVTLKFTCPGVPDTYQGCEGWDFSFVDPDNRRPVDFDQRSKWLGMGGAPIPQPDETLASLWADRYSGRIKCWITARLAGLRKARPALFADSNYYPVNVEGRHRHHVLAYARQLGGEWLLVALPLHMGGAVPVNKNNIEAFDWGNTYVEAPAGAPTRWRAVFTGRECEISGRLVLKDAWKELPMAVWTASAEQPGGHDNRAAGVLLPLFSLPGPFGAGDLGPEAFRFVDFLRGGKQKYWQLLPNNPTDEAVAYSPYSAHAAMAGNPLFLDLDWLERQGWLTEEELAVHHFPVTQQVDYKRAEALKNFFFGKAFRSYLQQWNGMEDTDFKNFCIRESNWLDDYAYYTVLKEIHRWRPWYAWARRYRQRDSTAIAELDYTHRYELDKAKWLQYLFYKQWKQLKAYCNRSGIQLFGDLPFYMNRDAVDVWAHPELFHIDRQGNMRGSAGVPPDYFNARGQWWGMPVYRWENHAKEGYRWWIDRIRKNLEWYDVLRLDHFRAFYDYWEIPAGAQNATEGQWQSGPGMAFFETLKNAVGKLPFIAEDLGDIHAGVYELRDALGFYGMKVLQFAFGGDVGSSPHAPHHHTPGYVVYPGTHDNNTVKGWYEDELTPTGKAQLHAYTGIHMSPGRVSHAFCRMAYASAADIAILPVQDLLGLGSGARINIPAQPQGNWKWRMSPRSLTRRLQHKLLNWVERYGR